MTLFTNQNFYVLFWRRHNWFKRSRINFKMFSCSQIKLILTFLKKELILIWS